MTIPTHIWDAYWSDVKPGTEAALERVVAAMRAEVAEEQAKPPTAFEWTAEMRAIWPAEMRPTMSGLLAIWAAMRAAAVFTSVPGPAVADADGWVEWHGGNKPDLPFSTAVDVKFRDGDCVEGFQVSTWYGSHPHSNNWLETGSPADIVAYRIPKPPNGGWIEWEGGDCPVSYRVRVDVKYRKDDGSNQRTGQEAINYWWGRDGGSGGEIIAYRICGDKV